MPAQHTTRPRLIYQMKVTLLGSRPAIWRRLQVDGNNTLAHLHLVLQAVMGWYNCHLHSFTIRGHEYGEPDPDGMLPLVNDRRARVMHALDQGMTFTYLYDFGDGWDHRIKVEKVFEAERAARYPVCLAGKRNCPPEDCGGIYGYADFLETLANPSHPEHENMLEWIGGSFDPERFSVEEVNRRLGGGRRARS